MKIYCEGKELKEKTFLRSIFGNWDYLIKNDIIRFKKSMKSNVSIIISTKEFNARLKTNLDPLAPDIIYSNYL